MRRFHFSTFILLFISFIINQILAQELTTKGIILGMNQANINGEDLKNTNYKVGFVGGAFVVLKVKDNIDIRPEVLFSMKGYKYKQGSVGYTTDLTTSFNYIDIPVLAVYHINENYIALAGPSINFYVNGKVKQEDKGDYMGGGFDRKETEDIESDTIRFPEFGLVFGGAYVWEGMTFEFRYAMGLTNVYNDDTGVIDMKNRMYQLMIGYPF